MAHPLVPLGSVVKVLGGGTPSRKVPSYWGGEIPWASVKDLCDVMDLNHTAESITQDGLAASAANLIPAGQVIIATRVGLGKVGVNSIPVAINQDLKALFCRDNLDARYLAHTLRHQAPRLISMGVGATVKGYNLKDLLGVEIPLPSLEEQRRISNLLDEADRLQRLRKEANEKAQRILPALFIEMFGDPETNPKGWDVQPLGELVRVKSGVFLPSKAMNSQGGFPVYGGNGVAGYHDQFMFEAPAIVIGRVGQACGAVHDTAPRSWVTDNALFVAESSPNLNHAYLLDALRTARLRRFAAHADLPSLSGARLAPVPLMVPPKELQRRYAFERDTAVTVSSMQQSATTRLEDASNALRSHLLAEATA